MTTRLTKITYLPSNAAFTMLKNKGYKKQKTLKKDEKILKRCEYEKDYSYRA